MPDSKPNYTDLVHKVVYESTEPLTIAEIVERVGAIQPITTSNPQNTVRAAIRQNYIVVPAGEGRYGWKPRLLTGSWLRIPLRAEDLKARQIAFPTEVHEALFPAYFANKKYEDRSPAHIELSGGGVTEWPFKQNTTLLWGTAATPAFWEWLDAFKPHARDELILQVADGEMRRYRVEFQKRAARDEPAIAARNRTLGEAILTYLRRAPSGVMMNVLATHLLGSGQYRDPVPPDPFALIWARDLLGEKQDTGPVIGAWSSIRRDEIEQALERSRRLKEAAQPASHAVPAQNTVYQLKVTLKHSQPPIWRRIQVPADIRLGRLHNVLQLIMGWGDEHLHQFKIHGTYYGVPESDRGGDTEDESRARLNQVAPRIKEKLIYEYDFGDSWEHEILVEKILPREAGVAYPRCIDGQRAGPPEDVGGVWGYANLIEALQDPENPEREDMLEWVGEDFDPEAFDVDELNKALKRIKS